MERGAPTARPGALRVPRGLPLRARAPLAARSASRWYLITDTSLLRLRLTPGCLQRMSKEASRILHVKTRILNPTPSETKLYTSLDVSGRPLMACSPPGSPCSSPRPPIPKAQGNPVDSTSKTYQNPTSSPHVLPPLLACAMASPCLSYPQASCLVSLFLTLSILILPTTWPPGRPRQIPRKSVATT